MKNNKNTLLWCGIAIILVLTVLVVPAVSQQNNQAKSLLMSGLYRFKQGKFIQAREDFTQIISDYQHSDSAPEAYMLLSKTQYALEMYDDALSTATKLRSIYPQSRYAEWADYMVAACHFQSGNEVEALDTLGSLFDRTERENLKRRSLRAIHFAIRPHVSSEEFSLLIDKHGINESDFEGLEPYSIAEAISIPESMVPEIESEQAESMQEAEPNVIKIGVIAPLSGSKESSGNQLVAGVQALLDDFPVINNKQVELLIEDTESDQITAVMKTRKLANEGVIAIIGPVYGESTVAAAVEANARKVPLLAPTAQTSYLPDVGNYVFQMNFSPVEQAKALARLAYNQLGCKNAAVIASEDEWGHLAAQAFKNEMTSLGSQSVQLEFFETNIPTYNFHPIIMSIREGAPLDTGYSPVRRDDNFRFNDVIVSRGDTIKLGPQIYPPLNSVHCIFISAVTKDAIKVAKEVKKYNINTILLGDSGWSSSNIARNGGDAVDGAYLVETMKAQPFNDRDINYQGLQGIVTLKGYDSAKAVVTALQTGVKNREELIAKLEQMQNLDGLSSDIAFSQQNHANQGIDFVKIQNKIYHAVDER